jgi:membrane protein required for colicin V production
MDLHLTWFDFAALAVLGLSGVMAFARGLIRELFSIIAFIGGGVAGYFLASPLAPMVQGVIDIDRWLAALIAGLLVFLVVFIVVTLVVASLAKTIHQSTEIGAFDRAAGLAFGVLRGVAFVALGVLLIRQSSDPSLPVRPPADFTECRAAYDQVQGAVRCARTYPIYDAVAGAFEVVLPRVRERTGDIIDRERGESAPIPPAEPASEETPPT